jgi:hypothetical protein
MSGSIRPILAGKSCEVFEDSPVYKVVGVKLVGSAYIRGVYHPGWGEIRLSNSQTVFVSEANSNGFDACLKYARLLGYNTTEYESRLDVWVKTGN